MKNESPHTGSTKIRLLFLMATVFILLNSFATGLVGYLAQNNGRNAVEQIAAELYQDTAFRINDYTRQFLSVPVRMAHICSALFSQGFIDINDPVALERFFSIQISSSQFMSSIYFGNTQGGLVDAGQQIAGDDSYVLLTDNYTAGPLHKIAVDKSGTHGKTLFTMDHFDARDRPWFKTAVERNQPVWNEPYVLSTNDGIAVALSAAIRTATGRLLGVLSIDIFAAQLNSFLRSLKIGETGQAYVFSGTGQLLATSNPDFILLTTDANGHSTLIDAKESNSSLIRDIAARLFGSESQTTAKEDAVLFTSQDHYIYTFSLQGEQMPDWKVAVTMPKSDFMGAINESRRNTYGLISVTILLTGMVSFFLSRRIVHPIERLNRIAADSWLDEDLDGCSRPSSILEIDQLSSSLCTFKTHLKEQMTQLNQEIAVRKQKEQSLLESEEKYVAVLDHQTDALLLHKLLPQGGYATFVEVNNRACDLYGYSREELLQLKITDLAAEEFLRHFSAAGQHHSLLKRKHLLIPSTHIKKSGESFPVEVSASIVHLKGEDYILSNVRDITARTELEKKLERSHKLHDKLTEKAKDAIIQINSHGEITFWNDAACEIFGYARGEALGQRVHDLLTMRPQDLDAARHAFPGFIAQGTGGAMDRTLELVARHKDGHSVPVELSLSALREDDSSWHAIAIIRDISERKEAEQTRQQLEQRLNQKQKMEALGVLAGGVAHNFNNNLAIILGNIELAELRRDHPSEHAEYLHNAEKTIMRSRDLVSQLLSFSSPTKNVSNDLFLTDILDESVNLLRSTLPKSVAMVTEKTIDRDDSCIRGNSSQIQEVMVNLVNNAVHAMKMHGTLTITLDDVELQPKEIPLDSPCQAGFFARLTIRDTGSGMDALTLEKIFDPFFTTKALNEGTGLGLSTVLGIMNKHQGLIKVHSQPNQGTAFELFFPKISLAENSEAEQAEPEKKRGSVQRRQRIMLVDDEIDIINLCQKILVQGGFEVCGVTAPEKALEVFSKSPSSFDLLITDQVMPGMLGTDLVAEIRARREDIPVILFSGYVSTVENKEIHQLKIDEVCRKPISYTNLVDTANRLLMPVK